jgi:hypothetical protein
MKKQDLQNIITNLYNYFGYEKKPDDKRVGLMIQQLENIPGEAAAYIYTGLIMLDSVPRNLPKAIKTIYSQWRTDNPSKTILKTDHCDDCKGVGYLIFTKIIHGLHYDFMCRCGECENWKGRIGENTCLIYTKEHLINAGYKVA